MNPTFLIITLIILTLSTSCSYTSRVCDNDDNNRMEDLFNYLPCGDTTSHSLYSLNVSNSDFCENGRTNILLELKESLANNGISLKPYILVGETEYTTYMKRLAKINGLEDIIFTMSDYSIEKITGILKTTRPSNIFVKRNNSHIEIGNIDNPVFKQTIFNTIYDNPKTRLSFIDSILQIKPNTDTIIELKNNGKERLYIYDIDSSCECNHVYVEDTKIDPEESSLLHIGHNSTGRTKTRTNILIYSNDTNGVKEIVLETHN